ncbi:TPM domain-containing protein [Gordonia aichiensis]|uniref:TPM domain-containing protein n=1 Tax=Gordonia aichiensis TaxID=36820 RepID=UPI003264F5E8
MISACRRRRLRTPMFLVVTALLALIVAAIGGVGTARAQAPMRMADQIVDTAGVFSPADHDRISTAIDDLYDNQRIQMWVVYVDSFDGLSREAWARQTEDLSELGARDVLLAVATRDRSYQLTSTTAIDGLTAAELNQIATDTLQPALKKQQWGASAVDTIAAIDGAAANDSSTGAIVIGAAGGLALLGGGAFLYTRRRKRKVAAERLDALREHSDSLTVDQLAEQPLDVLHAWSREVLTDTDNAVTTSADELTLAIGEFGERDAAPFTAAVQAAQQALASSFALRQRLDDDIPETPDEQRSMLVQIITSCSDADALLDEQVANFDALRNLLINAADRLDELTRRVVATSARLPQSEQSLAELTERHGGTVISSITGNITLARQQLQFAEDSIDQGREAITLPAGKQGPVVADIRSAEAALDTANKLLDAIDSAEETIGRARDGLSALVAEVRAEVAEAAEVTAAADSRDELAAAVAKAEAALSVAETDGATDPLRAFAGLVDADAELDRVLAAASVAAREQSRQAQLVTNALETAEAKTQAAADFIETRRGAIGSVARTRLSRAQQLGSEAVALAESSPAQALEKARQASRSADEALMAAQTDVVSWQDRQQPAAGPRPGSSGAGAVLTGILVDSVLRGSMRSGSWPSGPGGYSAGGRSPGSFGGSSSSGRIGTGGRF